MIHRKLPPFAILLALIPFAAPGCAAYRPLQIAPVSHAGAVIVPKFSDAYYYYDRDHTLYFVMRAHSTDPATAKPIEQIATFRIFWRPIGGKTTLDNTALNATYRYLIMTPDAIGMYEGAGFVRLWGRDGAHRLAARLMDGDLRLTEASRNFHDTLGRSRMRGNFAATYNDVKTIDMLQAAQREFYNRSLTSKSGMIHPAPAPGVPTTTAATVPAPSSPSSP